jgi:hypothetical protein
LNLKITPKIFLFLSCFIILTLISGCATSIFRSLNLAPDPYNSLSTLDKMTFLANSCKPYDTVTADKIISLGQQIINNPSSSATDKRNANYLIAVAQMGKSGNSIIEILGKIADIAQKKIDLSLLAELQTIVKGDVKTAADSFNTWSSTATAANDPQYQDRQLARSVTNASAVQNVVNIYYTLDTTTGLIKQPVDPSSTPKDRVIGIVDSGMITYANNSTAAANEVSSLTAADKALVTKMNTNTEKISQVSDALQGGAPYTGQTISGETVTIDDNTSPTDPNIEGVLNKLFQIK